jgi:hypothetical protein
MTRKKKRKLAREKAASYRAARAPKVAWESNTVETIGTFDDVQAIAAGMFQDANREDVPTLSEMPTPTAKEILDALSAGLGTPTAKEILDALSAGLGTIAPQEALTCVVDTSTGQTITINGEQVPATIVKDRRSYRYD